MSGGNRPRGPQVPDPDNSGESGKTADAAPQWATGEWAAGRWLGRDRSDQVLPGPDPQWADEHEPRHARPGADWSADPAGPAPEWVDEEWSDEDWSHEHWVGVQPEDLADGPPRHSLTGASGAAPAPRTGDAIPVPPRAAVRVPKATVAKAAVAAATVPKATVAAVTAAEPVDPVRWPSPQPVPAEIDDPAAEEAPEEERRSRRRALIWIGAIVLLLIAGIATVLGTRGPAPAASGATGGGPTGVQLGAYTGAPGGPSGIMPGLPGPSGGLRSGAAGGTGILPGGDGSGAAIASAGPGASGGPLPSAPATAPVGPAPSDAASTPPVSSALLTCAGSPSAVSVTMSIDDYWLTGFNATVRVQNLSGRDISSWSLHLIGLSGHVTWVNPGTLDQSGGTLLGLGSVLTGSQSSVSFGVAGILALPLGCTVTVSY